MTDEAKVLMKAHLCGKVRATEWVYVCICAAYAFRLMLPYPLTEPHFFPDWLDQMWWGMLLSIAVLVQISGLILNGEYWWSPIVRGTGQFLAAAPFFLILMGAIADDPMNAIVVPLMVNVSVALFCMFRSGIDMELSRKAR